MLIHGLQHGALSAGRGTIELISEDELGKDRSAMEGEALAACIKDLAAQDVGRQEIVGKLHPLEVQAEQPRHHLHQSGLAHSRRVLDEQIAPGDKTTERQLQFPFRSIKARPASA